MNEIVFVSRWIGSTQALSLKLLALAVAIDLLRETVKLVRGVHADFVDVLIRAAVAGVVIASIPTASMAIAGGVTALSETIDANGTAEFDKALGGAVMNFDCSSDQQKQVSGSDALSKTPIVGDALSAMNSAVTAIRFAFSPAGLLLFAGKLMVYAILVLKFFIIDVLWPVMFAATVYLGVITVPITFLREMGGLAQYVRQVVAVALWPVVFALLRGLMTASFSKLLERVAQGQVAPGCMYWVASTGAASGVASGSGGPGGVGGFMDVLQFMAVLLGMGFMLLKTPAICAALLGTGDPSHGLGGTVGQMLAGAGLGAARAGVMAAGGPAGAAALAVAKGAASGAKKAG